MRGLTAIATCLLAGAFLNVVVIYGVCLRIDYDISAGQPLSDAEWIPQAGGVVPPDAYAELRQTFGTLRRGYCTQFREFAQFTSVGWPAHSIEGGWCQVEGTPHYVGAIEVTERWADDLWPEHFLPVRPIWGGMLVNTIFYGGAIWLVVRGPWVIRRALRRWHGMCPRCGYNLRGSLGCSECGAHAGRDRTA